MQVNASVDESDIGRIRTGQQVTFRVDAYPDEEFRGTVRQVRLEPVVDQNVVSYMTVIDVPNPDLKLKPGMTANVTIEIARADDVLRVPNAALRFRPTTEVFTALGQQAPAGRLPAARPGSDSGQAGSSARRRGNADANGKHVWTLVDGHLRRIRVEAGINDGTTTAITGGDLQEGAQVVTGIATSQANTTQQRSGSPLIPQRPSRNRSAQGAQGNGR